MTDEFRTRFLCHWASYSSQYTKCSWGTHVEMEWDLHVLRAYYVLYISYMLAWLIFIM